MRDQCNRSVNIEERRCIVSRGEDVDEYADPQCIAGIESVDEEKESLESSVRLFGHLNCVTLENFSCLLLNRVRVVVQFDVVRCVFVPPVETSFGVVDVGTGEFF